MQLAPLKNVLNEPNYGKKQMILKNHKIEVTPEGRPGIYKTTPQQIKQLATEYQNQIGKTIHTATVDNGIMMGCDSHIQNLITKANQIQKLIDNKDESYLGFAITTTPNMSGHNLICATDVLEGWDIGDVTEDDLDLIQISPAPA